MPDEGADDLDGCPGPPPRGSPRGGGAQRQRGGVPGREFASYSLWSVDRSSGARAGFACAHDVRRGVLYAELEARTSEKSSVVQSMDGERSTKGAISTLLDVAEACNSRKLTLGLNQEDAASAELVCSLLYLGFQVVPMRKSPLEDAVLLLDFDIGWPGSTSGLQSSDQACTATSDCSTSAAEIDAHDSETDSG